MNATKKGQSYSLEGQRFGQLLVTPEYEIRKGRTYWKTICDCGKTHFVRHSHLTDGGTTSCTTCSKPKINLGGQQFGRWSTTGNHKRHKLKCGQTKTNWECICVCGTIKFVSYQTLVNGDSTSCGCLKKEQMNQQFRTHGKTETLEYKNWCGMKERCFNPRHKKFPLYGGRGITVCDRWRNSFENFFADMGPRPSPKHSPDRINNNGNYEPGNCRWATTEEQANNKRPWKRLKPDPNFPSDKPTLLYYIKLTDLKGNPLYKIGLTSTSMNQRLRIKYITVKEWNYLNGLHAWEQEQDILEEHAANLYKGPRILRKGNQELFTCDVLRLDQDCGGAGATPPVC